MEIVGVLLAIAGLVVVIVLIWAIVTYNGFVRLRNLVQEAWRQIDVELHRRYELIPNLLETVKGYAAHERQLFEEVTRARAQAAQPGSTPAQQAQQENELSSALGRLFAVAEGYPQLRAQEGFVALQEELTNTEDRIAAGRRFYNGNVRQLNTKTETFPPSIIASMFGFQRAEYFEVNDPVVRTAPNVSFADNQGNVGTYAPTQHQQVQGEATPSFGGQRGGYDPNRDAGRTTEGQGGGRPPQQPMPPQGQPPAGPPPQQWQQPPQQ
ncbi:LemA family protein [Georgenia alba]|uniref:LemA family protein n=1 Tax=Georgenia alba TaxID=2233858 RepID=A0ABW2QCN0_9MICO